MNLNKLIEVPGFRCEPERSEETQGETHRDNGDEKVRVILWVKIPGYLVTLGHGARVENADNKRNVCAVKKWNQFDISTYVVTKDWQWKILFQKNLMSQMPSFPQTSF